MEGEILTEEANVELTAQISEIAAKELRLQQNH